MKFLDYITIGDILFLPDGLDKYGAIRYMVTNAACFKSDNWTGETDSVIRGFLKREELGSLGIGFGVACPHTKHPAAIDISAVFGCSAEGVDYDSLDGKPASIFFLWASPPDRPGDQLRYCEMVSRHLRDDTFVRFLRQSESPEDILQLLADADANQFG